MFKRKKKKTGCQTPEFRKPTPPPPPKSRSSAVKPPNTTLNIQLPKQLCTYETPCGWCTKWDKKCDKKIGCSDDKPKRGLRAKTNIMDDAANFSYGKCLDCEHDGWLASQCSECNPENGFKYFVVKEN